MSKVPRFTYICQDIFSQDMPVLKKIVISDFRNIGLQEIEFSPNVNCISGNNGEGKTNLLDAITF